MSAPILQVAAVSKTFPPAVRALIDAHLDLVRGEVHALLGENGAGKSTLSRIIAGIEVPDEGTLTLAGRPYAPVSRRDAEHLGVRMVMQELNLIPTLTVAESIFVDRLPHRFGFIDRARLHEQAAAALAAVGLGGLHPATPVGALGIGQQQLVEIAAGLSGRCDVLILDEPTAALSSTEADLLFQQVARLKAAGVAIVYISHRMAEIARIADRITVLRDGRVVGGGEAAHFKINQIIRLMVGRDVGAAAVPRSTATGEVVLRAVGLRAEPAVRDVSFELHRGEILGLAGLMGSGRTETVRLLFGADPRDAGEIYLHGSAEPAQIHAPRDAVASGLALLTEDRKGQGLLLPWSVRRNTTLPSMQKLSGAAGWLAEDRERRDVEQLATSLGIRCASVDQPVRELSGGNQQKVIIAKWLYRDADILIFDEPTRGIDVGAKFEIYKLLVDLAERGKAILVVSSELPELIALCNRIAVLSAGTLVRTFAAAEFDPDAIMAAALSKYVDSAA